MKQLRLCGFLTMVLGVANMAWITYRAEKRAERYKANFNEAVALAKQINANFVELQSMYSAIANERNACLEELRQRQ